MRAKIYWDTNRVTKKPQDFFGDAVFLLRGQFKKGGIKMFRGKKGQSTLEYVLILTTVVAVIMVVASGVLKPKLEDSLNSVAGSMETKIKNIKF